VTVPLKQRVYDALHGVPGRRGLTLTQQVIVLAIMTGVAIGVVSTEPELSPRVEHFLDKAELVVGAIFLAEYIARLWCAGTDPQFQGLRGRLMYVRRPLQVIDLIALVPFFVGLLGSDLFVLRVIRVFRIVVLTKMVRYSPAMRLVLHSIFLRRYELFFAACLGGVMILVSSAAMYLAEGGLQPRAFGSIARAMWWSVVTLTTLGYGDVVPQTPIGRVIAGITAVAGIVMIAMPTGILAAAFSDGFALARKQGEGEKEDRAG
jgi:voltage-gated potassium channel